MLNKIIPDLLFDLRSAGEAFEDMKQMGLSGASPQGGVKTKAPNSDYFNHRDAPPVAARQAEAARDYLKRTWHVAYRTCTEGSASGARVRQLNTNCG